MPNTVVNNFYIDIHQKAIWFRRFRDKSKKVRWTCFSDHTVDAKLLQMDTKIKQQCNTGITHLHIDALLKTNTEKKCNVILQYVQ